METGLRKLWTRRKSKGRDGMPDSGVSSLRMSQSTDQTGLSSNYSPRSKHARTTSTDQGTSQFSPTSTADSSVRPVSSSKVQPMLVGVSRPSTMVSRPGTSGSGSLMNAVNRAADAVVKAEQESTKTYMRPKTPRYVDIFSLSNSSPGNPKPGYNEDVAERNLDLARVALEGTQQAYIPSSKFQEEVATRNAYPSLPSSHESSPSVAQGVFDANQMTTRARDISSRRSNHSQIPPNSADQAAWTSSLMQGSTSSHFRHQSEKSLESQSQIHELPSSRHGIEGVGSMQMPPNYIQMTNNTPEVIGPQSSPTPRLKHPGRQTTDDRVDETIPTKALRNYQLSATEMTQSRSVDQPPRTAQPIDQSDGSQRASYPMHSPSNLSSTSSVKRSINLPHRTIMDLTGNDSDVFSEGTPESNNSSSPILEHAKFDTMRTYPLAAVPGPTIETIEERNVRPAPPKPRTTPLLPEEDPVSELAVSAASAKALQSTSTFSPISTIASLTPRESVVLETPVVSTMAGGVEAEAQLSDASQDKQNNDAQTLESQQSVLQNGQGNKESFQNETKEPQFPVRQETAFDSEKPITNGNTTMTEGTKPVEIDRTVAQAPESLPLESELSSSSGAPPSVQAYIHMAPENLHSIDFVDPSRAFGVSTRDFARTPTKSTLTSVPEDPEPTVNGKPRHPGIPVTENRSASFDPHNVGTPPRRQSLPEPSLYKSTFDEAEFAQKQADARAALIRLQQSLNENFLMQPPPAPVVRSSKTGTSKHTFSFSDGKPVAPSSIFAQVRHTSPIPAELKAEADKPIEDARPNTSYHSLTTAPSYDKSQAVREIELASAKARPGKELNKGKQRAEAELNGPGPSIVNEEDGPRQPLPLPPPLHLNGHRLQHQSPVPPSPGEISLSSFPIPVSSPKQSVKPVADSTEPQASPPQHGSHHSHQSSSSTRVLRRQSSQRSEASSTSAFSIPYHAIPDRTSSIRDRSVMEEADE
ncbi:uncharacterized protein Z518_10935 [Rhinocladiella mackenziei CBS 650.93]|uniref:Uncharacterized protein n=1 Tax=Rhinocladiella mackenziei CBS 650.93 TaxID=1442369 RepID=A0A0D2GNW4_9EURO|nr:uncharacterized protein Z518_10935 [Rhinocladiella mackenziei CBS 650.93]KIX00008.1 hypothetical protein Z518_10935 [Rhinocladiella mackenziei CBS 650.93]